MAQPDPIRRGLRLTRSEDAAKSDVVPQSDGASQHNAPAPPPPASPSSDNDSSEPLWTRIPRTQLANLDASLAALGGTLREALAEGAGRIGHATVIARLGEGSYGEVFVAVQDPPLSRRVAIKVLKRGLETRSLVARFSLEQRALSRINHPAVVPILDSGVTEDGRPWFTMPLIEGAHLIDAADSSQLTLRDRLALFARVCDGVHAAHVQGIVHRDLKPGNILVIHATGSPPEPRIIDFGIARALDDQQDATQTGDLDRRRLGTLAYMAPEQIELGAGADARSDVYSLGIILDELVTGLRPKSPTDAATATGVRARASRRVSAASILAEEVAPQRRKAQARGLESAAAHARALRGDIDAIIARATMPEPALRYQSAEAFAEDVRRWLRHEPVSARVASRTYIAARFVRRRPGITAAVALGTLALAAIAALGYSRALEAERSESLARAAANQTREVNQVLASVLSGISPGVARGRDRQLIVEALDGAANKYFAELSAHSDAAIGEVARTLAKAYIELDQPAKAIALLEPALSQLAGEKVAGEKVAGEKVAGEKVAWEKVAGEAGSPRSADIRLLRARLLAQLGIAECAARRKRTMLRDAEGIGAEQRAYAAALDEFNRLGAMDDEDAFEAIFGLWSLRISWPGGHHESDRDTDMAAFDAWVRERFATLPVTNSLRWRYRLRAAEINDYATLLKEYPPLVDELATQRPSDDPELVRARLRLLSMEVAAAIDGRALGGGHGHVTYTDEELARKWRALLPSAEVLVETLTRVQGVADAQTVAARLWHAYVAGFDARWKWIEAARVDAALPRRDAGGAIRVDLVDAEFDPPPEVQALFDDLARDVAAISGPSATKIEQIRDGFESVRRGERRGAWWTSAKSEPAEPAK